MVHLEHPTAYKVDFSFQVNNLDNLFYLLKLLFLHLDLNDNKRR